MAEIKLSPKSRKELARVLPPPEPSRLEGPLRWHLDHFPHTAELTADDIARRPLRVALLWMIPMLVVCDGFAMHTALDGESLPLLGPVVIALVAAGISTITGLLVVRGREQHNKRLIAVALKE